ncbi:hypothetical protein ACOSQ3_014440 [Xanthoceras sorbifolium]
MDPEEFEALCTSLSIKEEEGPILAMDRSLRNQGQKKVDHSLIGKFLSNKLINGEAFRATIAKIWKMTQEVEIDIVQGNIYAFHFRNQADRMRVLARGPWKFDNALLIL